MRNKTKQEIVRNAKEEAFFQHYSTDGISIEEELAELEKEQRGKKPTMTFRGWKKKPVDTPNNAV